MKDVFLVYDNSCFYEIVVLNYFLKFTGSDMVLCSLDGKAVKTMEGYSVNVDMAFDDVDWNSVRSFVVTGGMVTNVDKKEVRAKIVELKNKGVLIAGICAGVDLLDNSGILEGIKSTHNTHENVVNDSRVITARANGYVDFAIEVAKELNLFKDEEDLQETISFWKYHQPMQ